MRDDELEELRSAIAVPRLANVPGSHHVVVAGPKGGTGKTTTAAMLATTLATWRGEIVSVLDATNQIGTLRRRLVPSSEPPTRPFQELCQGALAGDLAPEWSALAPYVDVVGGLRVLRSLSSPARRTGSLARRVRGGCRTAPPCRSDRGLRYRHEGQRATRCRGVGERQLTRARD